MNFDPTKYMSLGLYAIGVYDADNNRYTGLIVDALMPFIANPATIVVSIHNESYSLQKILQEKEFSVSILGQNTNPKVFAALGYQTGKDANKWENLDYFEDEHLPFLSDATAIMKAHVTQTHTIGGYTLIIAQIRAEKVLNQGMVLTYMQYQTMLKEKVIDIFNTQQKGTKMKEQWVCKVCGYVYEGDVPFEELPEDWTCPLCGVGKDQFEKVAQ